MLLRLEAPSWLYQVEMGATTVWERWDALAPDGTIHAGEMATDDSSGMLSFNHYAYGAVIDWIYRYVAGIAPTVERPGYRRIIVAPRPSTAIPWARASIETRLGAASIDWRLTARGLEIELEIPYGSEAVLDLPVTDASVVSIDGETPTGDPLGPGRRRIVVTEARVATPAALESVEP
jgi:alpha-L-rhamnosidase